MASYYFTFFKKLQVFNHVPSKQFHGSASPPNAMNLNNPHMLFGSSATGKLLNTNSGDSPIYQVLLARSMGTPGHTLINVTVPNPAPPPTTVVQQWPAMPPQLLAAWNDFQVTPATNKFLDVFKTWIDTSKVDDVPDAVLAQVPPPIGNLGASPTLFVASCPGDDGLRPGMVPGNFWDSSLIFLTNPVTNAIAQNVSTLYANDTYNLLAVVGNRDTVGYGRYLPGAPEPCEAACWVMVWNAGMGPAVKLPALSNLDPASNNGVYDIYFLRSGEYDVVGFQLAVQTVFDGLVEAVKASGMNLGGLTPEQWLKDQSAGAHLCAKVVVRRSNSDSWPSTSDTPFTNPRVAQKNLAKFDANLAEQTTNPNIVWKNFAVGNPLELLAHGGDDRWGKARLVFQREGLSPGVKLYLAAPRETVKRFFTRAALKELERVDSKDKRFHGPYPDGMVFALRSEKAVLELNALKGEMLAMSLGIQYDRKKLRPGSFGRVRVVQEGLVPVVKNPKEQCYENEYRVGGGFTLELDAYDPHHVPRRPSPQGEKPAKVAAKAPTKKRRR